MLNFCKSSCMAVARQAMISKSPKCLYNNSLSRAKSTQSVADKTAKPSNSTAKRNFVEELISAYAKATDPLTFLEVGCGSGVISLTILKALKTANGVAIEPSSFATTIAMANARKMQLDGRFKVSNHVITQNALLPENIAKMKFDTILSAPSFMRMPNKTISADLHFENLSAYEKGPESFHMAPMLLKVAVSNLKADGRMYLELLLEDIPRMEWLLQLNYKDKLDLIYKHVDDMGFKRIMEIQKL